MDQTLQEKYAEKIAKILEHAEKAGTVEEAQTFFEQAQRLMSKYAIEQEMVDLARGAASEEIVERHITYHGIYHAARFDVGSACAEAQDVFTLIEKSPKETTLYLVGYSSDVDRAIFLDAKVQVQALSSQVKWAAEQNFTGFTPMRKFKERRQFLLGYARGLAEKLERARDAGRMDAREEIVTATGRSDAEVSSKMELIIRSKKDRIADWYEKRYGPTSTITRNLSRGSTAAHMAGREAGHNADVGSAGRIGQRKALPGGES